MTFPQAAATSSADVGQTAFSIRLDNFEGPFDLLLQLISQHRMDVTEVALHRVTDEFIAYTKSLGAHSGLNESTEFLVVAATLLDLKAARLLPSGDVDDPEDLALLEVRDLLFARLLQYRAFKQIAELFSMLEQKALRRYPRAVSLEPRFDALVPKIHLGVNVHQFADIAANALAPKPVPTVGLSHLHVPKVSVFEQAKRMLAVLEIRGANVFVSFAELTSDCTSGVEIVARFLGLLELYREKAVTFDQPEPLGELRVAWSGEVNEHNIDVSEVEDYG